MLIWSLLDVDADEDDDNKGDGVENFRFMGERRLPFVAGLAFVVVVGVEAIF